MPTALFKCKQSLYVSEVAFLEKVRQENHKQKFENLNADFIYE